jgi:flagellin-like hook-associated protein FlgL
MSRIGSSINGYEQFLLTHLARLNQASLNSSLRLATGKNYNSPKDDPSAYLQLQSFEKQLSLVNDVQANVQIATTVGAQSQAGVDEIRTQLEIIREVLLLDEDGELTSDERDANQVIIDEAVAEIRSAMRTSINGRRYLDGSFNYTFSGKNPTQINTIDVMSLRDDTTIAGSVTTAATQASVSYFGPGARINGNATFTLTGKRGAATISVVDNEQLTAARDRINAESHNTGITASVSGNNLIFTTVDYGDDATIDINVTSGSFSTAGTTAGTDAVVTINGRSISSSDIDGNKVSFRDTGIHAVLYFQAGFTGAFSTVTVSDDSVARFSLSTRINDPTKFAVPSLAPEVLGGVSGKISNLESGGTLAGLGTNTAAAIRVVDEALDQLTMVEGRVSAFADIAVASAGRLMDELASQLESSIDAINTVDEDAETLLLAKNSALAENTVSALAIMQQQQSFIFSILNQIAGL